MQIYDYIGKKVKVKDQCIEGIVTRHDVGNKVFVLEDNPEWVTEDDTGELIFHINDLIIVE